MICWMLASPGLRAQDDLTDVVDMCDFQIPESVAKANAPFTVVYAIWFDDRGSPAK